MRSAERRAHHPIALGAALAVLAALSFGATTPLVERAGRGLGPLTTAALLYTGAALSAALLGRVWPAEGAPLLASHRRRLLAVAFFGAGVAPTLLAWGLQRTGGTSGSLLLNLEAVFTVLLAWAVYREPIGSRVRWALGAMALGGVALGLDAAAQATFSLLGTLAVTGATLAWGLDNTLTRGLSEQNPVAVVAGKGALGALLTGGLALAFGEPAPGAAAVAALLACGATGYGLSLRLYLRAQRQIGAARTGSIFALAPFVGAALGWALGERALGPLTLGASGLFGLGVYLHVTERHAHPHLHPPLLHEHPHRHDDGHHDHVHDHPVVGEHTHLHAHEALEHTHEHAPDFHHDHAH